MVRCRPGIIRGRLMTAPGLGALCASPGTTANSGSIFKQHHSFSRRMRVRVCFRFPRLHEGDGAPVGATFSSLAPSAEGAAPSAPAAGIRPCEFRRSGQRSIKWRCLLSRNSNGISGQERLLHRGVLSSGPRFYSSPIGLFLSLLAGGRTAAERYSEAPGAAGANRDSRRRIPLRLRTPLEAPLDERG